MVSHSHTWASPTYKSASSDSGQSSEPHTGTPEPHPPIRVPPVMVSHMHTWASPTYKSASSDGGQSDEPHAHLSLTHL